MKKTQSIRNLPRLHTMLYLVVFLAAACADSFGGKSDDSQITVWYQEADTAFEQTRYQEALEGWQKALGIARSRGNQAYTLKILNRLGVTYKELSQHDAAMDASNEALGLAVELDDREGEAIALENMGIVFARTSQYKQALKHLTQSLALNQEIGRKTGIGSCLTTRCAVYMYLGQFDTALDNCQRALPVHRETGSKKGEAATLNHLASVYKLQGKYGQALDFYQQAMDLFQDIGNPVGVVAVSNNLGMVQGELGLIEKARQNFQRALAGAQELGRPRSEAIASANLGLLHSELEQYDQALEFHMRALEISKKIDDRSSEAIAVANIGSTYGMLGRHEEALKYLQHSLVLQRKVGDRRAEGETLNDIGAAYFSLGQYDQSLATFGEALEVLLMVGAQESTWISWNGLQAALSALDRPESAILAGKQAVEVIQSLRTNIANQEQATQDSFFSGKMDVYRDLADLLLQENRLAEAEQILDMLKEEEYFDFIKRDEAEGIGTAQAVLTSEERTWLGDFQAVNGRVVELGREWQLLMDKDQLTAAEETRLEVLDKQLNLARDSFLSVLGELKDEFSSKSGIAAINFGEKQLEAVESQQELLSRLGKGVVMIHTVITDDRLHLLLTTPHVQVARSSMISSAELRRKIMAFRSSLRSPGDDPLPAARQLYDLLVGPLEQDLLAANAGTLMWYQDGPLRYVPMAALHDGKQFLVERYGIVMYTAAARGNLESGVAKAWSAAGLGVSESRSGFPALASVPGELDGIIKQDETDPNGVMPGVVYLNDRFDKRQLKRVFGQNFPVMHLATHFKLQPGDIDASYLLLGDGDKLKLSEFRKGHGYRFRGVDLLTLSACNTAMGDSGQGTELESFAALAQKRGARGVLATLWPVDDASTGLLMQQLYLLRERHNLTKAEALRRAQMRWIDNGATARNAYSHPYYWAPFVLMGNWL